MKKVIVICLVVFCVNHASADIYIDDGLPHTFDDSTYWYQEVDLDRYTANTPGTHVDLVDGGEVGMLFAHNNASINMTGGWVEHTVGVFDNATFNMSGGSIGSAINATGNSNITISDGFIDFLIVTTGNVNVTMTGGSVAGISAGMNTIATISGGEIGSLDVLGWADDYPDSTIYLVGSGFEVDGQMLSYGDKLSDFGIFNTNHYGGTITGTLADGSPLDALFFIHNTGYYEGTADIYVIPEPTTLLLLGLGAVMLRHRRRHCL